MTSTTTAKRHRWPKYGPGACRCGDKCLDCGLGLDEAKRGGTPCERPAAGPDWLEIFQQPPALHETDAGTVDPFTESELAAISRYQQSTEVIPDCLDGVFLSGASAFTGMAAEQGWYDTLGYAKAHLGWIGEWHDALDSLHAGLTDSPSGHPSDAADRLLRHQARALIQARDKVWAAILCWLLGDAGPQLTDGALTLSNGYVYPRSW